MDLLASPSSELLAFVERIQLGLSAGVDPKLLLDRTPEGREKDVQRLRQVAARTKSISEFDDLDPLIKPSYAAVASPEAFEAQIEQLVRMSTGHESILALQELLDVWNHVAGVIGTILEKTDYRQRKVLLATSVSRSLSARSFLSPDGEVQIILFFSRLPSFIEHVSYLLPLAIEEQSIDTESLDEFPDLALRETDLLSTTTDLEMTMRTMLSRYRDGAATLNRKWSHRFGQYQRLVAQDMASAMQFFIVAHELVHCLFEHKGGVLHWSFASEGPSFASKTDVRELGRTWDQELEADYFGFKLGMTVAHRHGIPRETYCWSCYLLFYALSRCSTVSIPAQLSSDAERWRQYDSHPPLAQRQSWVEEISQTIHSSAAGYKGPVSFAPIKALCRILDSFE